MGKELMMVKNKRGVLNRARATGNNTAFTLGEKPLEITIESRTRGGIPGKHRPLIFRVENQGGRLR